MADLAVAHSLLGLIVSTVLTAVMLKPYLRRQPDLLPMLGVFGVVVQRWQWHFRGTSLFLLETPVLIALVLSLSRIIVLFFAPETEFSGNIFYRPQLKKKIIATFFILICAAVAFQVYDHDIYDPAIDTLLTLLVITNLSLFGLAERREAVIWAYAYNSVAMFLAGTGLLSPLAASGFYAGSFLPALILKKLKY